MDEITTIYERLGERVTFSDFKAKVEEKVAMMGGLCDEETAALLIAQELGAGEPIIKIKDMTPDGRSVCFTCKVVSISDPREFSRSDGSAGRVANITVGDETGKKATPAESRSQSAEPETSSRSNPLARSQLR